MKADILLSIESLEKKNRSKQSFRSKLKQQVFKVLKLFSRLEAKSPGKGSGEKTLPGKRILLTRERKKLLRILCTMYRRKLKK